jgi:hypothetical protein
LVEQQDSKGYSRRGSSSYRKLEKTCYLNSQIVKELCFSEIVQRTVVFNVGTKR